MNNPTPVANTAAQSGIKALVGGAKGITLLLAATILVIGGVAGFGLQWASRPAQPALRVVQRHATQLFFASDSPKTVQVACAERETLLGGGFEAGPLSRVVYSGIAPRQDGKLNTWRVVAYTGAEELSAFATCVNATIPTSWEYSGGNERSCSGSQLTGGGFGIHSTISGQEWGATWSTRSHPVTTSAWKMSVYSNGPSSDPIRYVQMFAGAVCAKVGVDKPEIVSTAFSVPRNTAGGASAACPKGKSLLSGGYFTDDTYGIGDKLTAPVFALLNAPGKASDPSPSPTAQWFLTTQNNETATSRDYNNYSRPSPPARQMTIVALCARITAAATDLTPTSSPPTATATPPTAIPSATAAQTPVSTPSPTPQPAPMPPSVSIQQPASGAALKRACDQQFQGTALTVPGNQPITDPQATQWTLRNTQTNIIYPLGNGASGQFTIPLAPDGQSYVVEFKATDLANGLSATATVPVSVRSCIA
jgi:hypothetical protein